MKRIVWCAFNILVMIFLSSCFFFLLVASESTRLRANLDTNDEIESASVPMNVHSEQPGYEIPSGVAKPQHIFHQEHRTSTESPNNADEAVLVSDSGGAHQIDPKDIVFLETFSKNSGITENIVPEMPSPSLYKLAPNHPHELIDNTIDDSLSKLQNFSSSKKLKNNDEYIVIAEPKILQRKTEEQALDVAAIFNDSGGGAAGAENGDQIERVSEEQIKKVDIVLETVNDTNVNLTEENPIPVYSEWAQKHIEEAVKQEQETVSNLSITKKNATVKQSTVKLREKNYASPDCGAKIIASNPEAQSTSSVLSGSRDEYMLNPCQARIWFVVELCEPIRAEKVELANFELFSSSPKQFSVAVSNRYPTRDWSLVGQFVATDQRTIQKFELHPHLFGKFVRVEVHSHYSSEHFCPISLFSVFGTSEFEAFATENEVINSSDEFNDDDDEEVMFDDKGVRISPFDDNKKKDQNILKSASDVVMSMVKKAAEVLTKSNDNRIECTPTCNKTKELEYTPNHQVRCDYCFEEFSAKLNETLQYKYYTLMQLVKTPQILDVFKNTKVCLNFLKFPINTGYSYRESYINNLLPTHYSAAICNILHNAKHFQFKFKFNKSHFSSNKDGHLSFDNTATETSQTANPITESTPTITTENTDPALIDPTKVEEFYETTIETPPLSSHSHEPEAQTTATIDSSSTSNEGTFETDTQRTAENSASSEQISTITPLPKMSETATTTTGGDDKLGNGGNVVEEINVEVLGENGSENGNGLQTGNGNQAVPLEKQRVHTESVFIRLSNRIKSLERNLSISEQYLEELSRSYKKQVEDLQQSFTKLQLTVEEQNRRSTDRETLIYDENKQLRKDMDELTDKMNWWFNIFLIGFVIVEILVVWLILRICRKFMRWRHTPKQNPNDSTENVPNMVRVFPPKRRISLEEMKNEKLTKDKRHLSEEALQTYGTYGELLIYGDSDSIRNISSMDGMILDKPRKTKNRQRKQSIPVQSRAVSMERPTNKIKTKMKLFRHESAPNAALQYLSQSQSSEDQFSIEIRDSPLLEEHDEMYVPHTDLALNEFMPNGPSYHLNGTMSSDATDSSKDSTVTTTKTKSRRLSSPAFFKAALGGRSSSSLKSKSPNHEIGTGWEWYKINKKSSSQDKNKLGVNNSQNHNNGTTDDINGDKISSATASATPKIISSAISEVILESINGKASSSEAASTSSKSNKSRNSASSSNSIDSSTSGRSKSVKKSPGNFRRLFKKVF